MGGCVNHLDRPLNTGDPTAAIPARWINDVDEVLKRLDVYGGSIQRNDNRWTIFIDELLDSAGQWTLPSVTITGRWVTGEAAAPATKTCYAARIFGNDTNHRAAINLDAYTLLTNEAAPATALDWTNRKLYVGATEMLHWNATTDTARSPYMLASRGLKLAGQPARYEKATDNVFHAMNYGLMRADATQHAEIGWPWATTDIGGTIVDHHVGYFSTHTRTDTANTIDYAAQVWLAQGRTVATDEVRALEAYAYLDSRATRVYVARAQKSTASIGFSEAFRAETDTLSVSILRSDTDADIIVRGTSGPTYGVRSIGKPIMCDKYMRTDSEYRVGVNKVVSARVVDARCDDTINTAAMDTTTAGVIDALRDAMIHHGLIAAA
jgi:hypothetical protein